MGRQGTRSHTAELNDYEKARLQTIEENNRKLNEIGISKIVQSLEAVASKKRKNRKGDEDGPSNKIDAEYISSDTEEDEAEDHDDAVNRVPLKLATKKRAQYIPPMSFRRTRSQVVRKVTDGVSFQEIIPRTRKEKEVIPSKGKEKEVVNKDTSDTAIMTMAEMILMKTQKQKEKEGIKKELAGQSSQINTGSPTQISPTIERQSSDNNEGLSKELERGELMHAASDQNNALFGDEIHLHGFTDSELEDEEVENQNQNNDSETESDEEVLLDAADLELEVVTSQGKTRGPSFLHNIHKRTLDERKMIVLNELGQPAGPILENDDVVAEYSRFLGSIARDYSYAPLVIRRWDKVPNKDKMWEYVLTKYIVPEEGKTWTLSTIGDS